MTKILGFIGLGNMGGGMARNLLSAGYKVVGLDKDNAKLTEIDGIQGASSVTEVAQMCEIVSLCLPNPGVSSEVIDQILSKGRVATIIETGTLTPEIVSGFSDKASAAGKKFLSAPMIGGKNQAANGTIEFLVEGSEADLKSHQELFNAMGRPRFMGNVPDATLAKLTYNLCRYANLAVGVEVYRLLQKYQANTKAIYEFMGDHSLDNFGQVWREDLKDMMTMDIPFKPSQVPNKDLELLIEMAKDHQVDSELIEVIRNAYLAME